MELLRRLSVLVCLLFMGGLAACGQIQAVPPQAAIEVAIATQLAETQQALIVHLAPQTIQTPSLKLRQVKVTQREKVTDSRTAPAALPIYHVQGTYQALIQLPSRQVKEDSIFDLYLQPQGNINAPETIWKTVQP